MHYMLTNVEKPNVNEGESKKSPVSSILSMTGLYAVHLTNIWTGEQTLKLKEKYNNLGRGNNAFLIVLNPLINSHGLAYFLKASNNLSNV